MAMPWYGWVGISLAGIAVVAIVANAVGGSSTSTANNQIIPPTPGYPPTTNTDAEVTRGVFGVLGQVTTGILAKVGRDDAARESALVRADRLARDERESLDDPHRREDLGLA